MPIALFFCYYYEVKRRTMIRIFFIQPGEQHVDNRFHSKNNIDALKYSPHEAFLMYSSPDAGQQGVTGQCPFASVRNDFPILKTGFRHQISKAIHGEAEEIIRFFMMLPVHWTRQNKLAARF